MKTERDWTQEILRNSTRRNSQIIELGAHHGNDTVPLYEAAKKPCQYLAVEADPRNIPVLRERVSIYSPIKVVHAAIWSSNGTIPFHLCEGNANGSSSARKPLKHLERFPDIPFEKTVLVRSLTLDYLSCAYIHPGGIDLIWCDIQGAERDMIAGGEQTLARTAWLLAECDQVEMYEGQATRDQLLTILGPSWELVEEWPADANLLLRNKQC